MRGLIISTWFYARESTLHTSRIGATLLYTISHSNACVYILDDLEGSVEAGGFGEGFHEGIVPFLAVDYLKHPVLTVWLRLARLLNIMARSLAKCAMNRGDSGPVCCTLW
jgi:hypothetical protein